MNNEIQLTIVGLVLLFLSVVGSVHILCEYFIIAFTWSYVWYIMGFWVVLVTLREYAVRSQQNEQNEQD